jgi:hypothetical protein
MPRGKIQTDGRLYLLAIAVRYPSLATEFGETTVRLLDVTYSVI